MSAAPISLREPTCTADFVHWIRSCEVEDADCLVKVAAFAIRFFATIICFASIVGIPFYLLAVREEALQEFEEELIADEQIANPRETGVLQRQIRELTAEVDRLKVTPAKADQIPTFNREELIQIGVMQAKSELEPQMKTLETDNSRLSTEAQSLRQELEDLKHAATVERFLEKSRSKDPNREFELMSMLGGVTEELLNSSHKASKLFDKLQELKPLLPEHEQTSVDLMSPPRKASVSRVTGT